MRVTKPCDVCGARFELTAGQVANLSNSVPRTCSKACRAEAEWQRRSAAQLRKHGPCRACGSGEMVGRSYGVILCKRCFAVAWTSCWRKVPHQTEEAAVATYGDDVPMIAYKCDLCDRYHSSKRMTHPPAEGTASVARIAAYFKAEHFDIDERRGWSNADRFPPPTGATP